MDQKKLNALRDKVIKSGEKAVKELIKVAEDRIIIGDESDLSADKLKNAAASKKLAIFDALDILDRISSEQNIDNDSGKEDKDGGGFAERRAGG